MHRPEKSAKTRSAPSIPLRKLASLGLIVGDVLDYGGGKGTDYFYLRKNLNAYHWDPNFEIFEDKAYPVIRKTFPFEKKFDTILCTYVLNVLPQTERTQVINHVRSILKPNGIAYFSVRGPKDCSIKGVPFEDGTITASGTFQRTFSAGQLQAQIEDSKVVLDRGRFVTISCYNAATMV